MDLRGLRARVLSANFATLGVPATVTVPAGAPVSTRVIWLDQTTAQVPSGEFRRAEARRVLAIRRDAVAAVPKGTVIAVDDGTTWRVDSIEGVEAMHHLVVVLRVTP